MTEQGILAVIQKDEWMMEVLKTVQTLNLPDWWIGAGFVRSKVWDHLHNYTTRTPLPDIDVIYFDREDFKPEHLHTFSTPVEDLYQKQLHALMPESNWSVTNQARMYETHHHQPYKDATEGLSHWSETATSIGVGLRDDQLVLTAPHEIDDLVNLILRPIPGYAQNFSHDPELFTRRIKEKKWLEKWPKLKVEV